MIPSPSNYADDFLCPHCARNFEAQIDLLTHELVDHGKEETEMTE